MPLVKYIVQGLSSASFSAVSQEMDIFWHLLADCAGLADCKELADCTKLADCEKLADCKELTT